MKWIIVPNWDKFQHYGDRDPLWIKNYRTLLHNPDYLELSLGERGLLHGIWLAYAEANGRVNVRTLYAVLTPRSRWFDAQLDSLVRAGFIQLSASKPLALARARKEKRREEKEEDFSTFIEPDRDPDALQKIQQLAAMIQAKGHHKEN